MSHVVSVLLTAIAFAVLPGVAVAAPSGSITDVRPTGSGETVTATYTSTFDICDDGYCGWFPYANEVPAAQACREDDNTLTYVGDFKDESGTQRGTDTFTPAYTPTKICLYARHSGEIYLLAEYVYPAAATTPTPTPTPTPTGTTPDADAVRPMTIAEGRSLVPDVLRDRYGSRFARSTLTRACHRLSTTKIRCRVAWRKKPFRYRGTVTLWNDPDDAESFAYRTSIKRTRI